MTETIDKAEFLRLARAAGFYHYDMPDVEGQDLGQSLEADGRGAVDRLVASLQAHITDRLAAAEARNATLTDDAAHADQYAEQLGRELAKATSEIQALTDDAARLDWLRENSCDLRCIDVPTGGGDGDVHWVVVEHYMAKPHEREIGRAYSDEPREAIDAAIQARAAASISTKEGNTHAD